MRPRVVLVCALALLQGTLMGSIIPPFAGPDEPAHFDYVQRLAEVGRLPDLHVVHCERFSPETRALESAVVFANAFQPQRALPPILSLALPDPADPRSRATTGCSPSGTYPPLYYASAAVPYRLAGRAPLFRRIFAVRLASAAWGALGAAFAVLLGWWWFATRRDALLMGILWLAQPMIAFLSAVGTNDSALFACSSTSFAAIALIARGQRRGGLVLLAAATLAGAMTKPTFSIFLPVFAACCVSALGARRVAAWLATAAAIAPAAIATVAWSIFIRPGMRYVLPLGDPPIPWRELVSRWVLDPERLYRVWVETYWMSWGWLDTSLSSPYYRAIALLLVLAAAGALLGWRRLPARDRWLVALAAGSTAYGLVALHALEREVLRGQGMPFVQGRYLVPLFPLQAMALVVSLRAFSQRWSAAVDGPWLFASVLVLTDAAAIARLLTRYYS